MTQETAEKKAIKMYLNLKGYFVYHNLAGIGVFKGIPDLTAIKNGIVWQIEVKAKGGRQSEGQKEFEKQWQEQGINYLPQVMFSPLRK